jgi:hypothetical protein
MMRLRLLVPMLGLVSMSVFAAACSSDDDVEVGGAAGAGGEGQTPDPGTGGDTSPGGACATDGSGTLVLEVTGLPDGVDADISIDGPEPHTAAGGGSLTLDSGDYVVSAARVFDEDPIVRTVYEAQITAPAFCLGPDASRTLKVTYAAIPSSNKLWIASGKDDELAGFSSADIAETAEVDASVSIDTPGAVSIAFDKNGNLWAVGPTIGEDMLVRIPAAELGDSGTREPDIKIKVPEIECFPFINHIAFDPHGNLWLSACEDQLRRINAADLTSSGDKESDVLFTEVVNNQGIAFDAAGNLWVAGGPSIERFDAARLDISDIDAPDLKLEVSAALGITVLGPEELAFDKAGNLWGISGSTVFQIASSDLDGTGEQTVKANVSFDVDVLALPFTPAFDDGNGLWVSLASGQFGRFSPTQLGESAAAGAPVTPDVLITSDSVTSGLPIALFPAPQGLPLYHSLPEE